MIDLTKYEGVENERWQYSWPGCEELDRYIRVEGDSSNIVGEVRGWGHLSVTYGSEEAARIQDLRGELMARAPALLAELKKLREENERLLEERARREKLLQRLVLAVEVEQNPQHPKPGCLTLARIVLQEEAVMQLRKEVAVELVGEKCPALECMTGDLEALLKQWPRAWGVIK